MPQEIQQYLSDDARITLDVRVENETVWLTQAQMAVLFDTTPQNITIHIRNVYSEKNWMNFQLVRISYKFVKKVRELSIAGNGSIILT